MWNDRFYALDRRTFSADWPFPDMFATNLPPCRPAYSVGAWGYSRVCSLLQRSKKRSFFRPRAGWGPIPWGRDFKGLFHLFTPQRLPRRAKTSQLPGNPWIVTAVRDKTSTVVQPIPYHVTKTVPRNQIRTTQPKTAPRNYLPCWSRWRGVPRCLRGWPCTGWWYGTAVYPEARRRRRGEKRR